MKNDISMTIEHANPITGEVSMFKTTPEELQSLADGLKAANDIEQLRLGEKEDFPIPQDAEPYMDERYAHMRERFMVAIYAHEAADAEKKHATKLANIQKRRVAYLEVRMAEERARCLSIEKDDVHVLAIDRKDAPEALPIDEWFLMSGQARVESVVYSVWLNGMETPYEEMPQPEDALESSEE